MNIPQPLSHVFRRSGSFRRLDPLTLALLTLCILVAAAALAVWRPPSHRSPLAVIKYGPAATVVASATSVTNGVPGPTAPLAAAATAIPSPVPPTATPTVLRPGAILTNRIDASLDGSRDGDVVIASRAATASGCDRWYLDIYAYKNGTAGGTDGPPPAASVRGVFDSTAAYDPYGPLLPEPAKSGQNCAHQLDLMGVQTLIGGAMPVVLATVTQPDQSQRLIAITLPAGADQAKVVFDATIAAGATVRLLDGPSRIELVENAFADGVPAALRAGQAPVGVLERTISGTDSGLAVTAGKLSPACGDGTIAARVESDGQRWLRVRCAVGTGDGQAVYRLAPGLQISPSGAVWSSLRDGDEVSVTVDGASLAVLDPRSAVPTVTALTLRGAAAARTAATATPPAAATTAAPPSPSPTRTATATATAAPTRPAVPVASAQPPPAQPAPAQPASAQPAPAQPAPVQPAPAQPAPVRPAPAEPAPVQSAPVAPATVQPATRPPAPTNPPAPAPVPPTAVPPPQPPPGPSGGLAPAPTVRPAPAGGGGLTPPTPVP